MTAPTDVLRGEHLVIGDVLTALEAVTTRFVHGYRIRREVYLDAGEFLDDFVDRCHHRKEAELLFPAVTGPGAPPPDDMIAAILRDHERGRAYISQLRAATSRFLAGDSTASHEIAASVTGYVELVREHMFKEEAVVFPMADEAISRAEGRRMLEEFDRMERAKRADARQYFASLAVRIGRDAVRVRA